MILHTPVVLTGDDAVALAARSRNWPVVRPVAGRLVLTGVRQTAPLPEDRMRIERGSLQPPHAAGWAFVLAWLEKHLHRPAIVTAPDSWASELALWAASSRGWPFRLTDDLSTLPADALLEETRRVAPAAVGRRPGVTNALLVSHDPDAPRTRAWLGAATSEVEVHLVSASGSASSHPRHVVADLGPANLAPGPGELDPVAAVAFTHVARKPFDPSKERAGYWQHALERYFEARSDHFDVVVITDAPAVSGFAAWAQRNWYARTVLDRPEPFARGMGKLSGKALAEARSWERGWGMAADVVTVRSVADVALQIPSGPDFRVVVLPDDDVPTMTGLFRELGDHTYTPV